MHGIEQAVEILSSHGILFHTNHSAGSNSAKNAKLVGSVTRVYDKALKGYIFALDSANCKLQFPKDEKVSLALNQAYLCLQINIPATKPCSLELTITDNSKVY